MSELSIYQLEPESPITWFTYSKFDFLELVPLTTETPIWPSTQYSYRIDLYRYTVHIVMSFKGKSVVNILKNSEIITFNCRSWQWFNFLSLLLQLKLNYNFPRPFNSTACIMVMLQTLKSHVIFDTLIYSIQIQKRHKRGSTNICGFSLQRTFWITCLV